MNLNNLYEAIIELQYELSGQHHDAEISCLDYKVIKALAATYELQDYLVDFEIGFCVALFVAPREKTFQRACVTVDRTVGQPFLSHLKNHVVEGCRIEAIDGEGHIQSFGNCVKMLFVSC